MKTYKLKSRPYAQAHVVETADTLTLISYQTDVLTIKKTAKYYGLYLTGLYSVTTAHHISAFLKDYCPRFSYQLVKELPFNTWVYFERKFPG